MSNSVKTAIYLRLSSADGADSESNSIQNQRAFLCRWAEENGFAIIREFVDDGCTGTDFNRSGFQQLNESIMSGEIHCLLVKDLSRLGRNYAETGRYMEQIFPRMGIRFIAVNDGYDSARSTDNIQQMAVFRNVFNDFYAADCSQKVRSSLKILKKQGKYLGGPAPYGYRLDPEDKYHLLPDPDTGPVVQQIFRLFLRGETRTKIAARLTRQGIPSPARQKALKSDRRDLTGEWSTNTLKRILSSRVYVGDMEQQLTRTVSYKVHLRRAVPEEEHILVPNTHRPLVSREDFAMAQEMLKTRSYETGGEPHLLTGLVFCGDCGAPMYAKRRGTYWYLNCYRYYKSPALHLCSPHSIREDRVVETIRQALRKEAQKLVNVTALIREKEKAEQCPDDKRTRKTGLLRRREKIESALVNAYRDKCEGLLSAEEFNVIRENLNEERQQLSGAMEEAESENRAAVSHIRERVERFLQFEALTKAQLGLLVKRVEIGEEKEITIAFAFCESTK